MRHDQLRRLAILAQLPENWLRPEARLLIALETVTVSDNGERLIGMRLLAEKARLPYGTARDARDGSWLPGSCTAAAAAAAGTSLAGGFSSPSIKVLTAQHLQPVKVLGDRR